MNIVITGPNSSTCNPQSVRTGAVYFSGLIGKAVEGIGGSARYVAPANLLAEEACPDVAFIPAYSPFSFTMRHVPELMVLIRRLEQNGKTRIVYFLDDFKVEDTVAGFHNKERYTHERAVKLQHRHPELILSDEFRLGYDNYTGKHDMVAPFFPWGERHFFKKRVDSFCNNLYCVDPTPLVTPYPSDKCLADDDCVHRERRWVLATLRDHADWILKQHFKWPVRIFSGLEKVKESQLQFVYSAYWGVLAPTYKHAGSGWWRMRYLMSAWSECILYASGLDRDLFPEPYRVSAEQVEGANDKKLVEIAKAQAGAMTELTWSLEQCLSAFSIIVKGGVL